MEAYSQRELDLARLAAFVDGEGSILLGKATQGKRAQGYRLRITVVNTDVRMPMWCKEAFGGSVRANRKEPDSGKRLTLWMWCVSHKTATDLLKELLPFFIIKREQAEIGIAFGATFLKENRSCKGLPESVKSEREGLRGKMFEIRRGRPDLRSTEVA